MYKRQIGTILILVSTTSLAHIINGSVGRGATAIREGGGWIGYGVSTPLITLVTEILAIPILIILLIFGLLVITKTSFSKLIRQFMKVIKLGTSGIGSVRARRAQRLVDEDFEVSETPPFETPLVKDLVEEYEPSELDYEVEPVSYTHLTLPTKRIV